MKLTCCCGASIELGEDAEYPAHGGAPRCVVEFRQYHEPCILAWRRSVIMEVSPGCTPRSDKDTQTMPHPNYYGNWRKRYQRFRDAISEGKRVFHLVGGLLHATLPMIADDGTAPPSEELFIDGVDVPPRPPKDVLNAFGYRLTGECRSPKPGERYCAITDSGVVIVNAAGALPGFTNTAFSGRRWILKRESEG